ncbi:uncharacterized protein LOC105899570 [Clupea harengus]|uniref:Uncharacterized protein LOC105899570 n=1 Tax=Clupea harengus TaxID=7950 RepID=A0A6P8GPD0_CLUHA|nr:uncharacterized protein LOC105899570 [Clupea harengus]XP_031436660.1 uncharacterized protein LOC105899570 [Clupea harengus]
MDAQIAKTTQSFPSAAEMRDTTQMLMQPNANWEEYLTPAPLSIAIMGELVFISSGTDFSINKNPPPTGFKYIKYPESFRACLMQICNSGWHAFNEAHKNMDQIRMHTATVPDYMKVAVEILFEGNDEVIETLLPNQLEAINTIADECKILAEGVENKYSIVINLIQELLEACVNAEHFHGEELEKVKMKLKENEMREKTAKELDERSKKAMENMSKQLEDAQDEYKKSMDSLPSWWEMIGTDLAGGITESMTGIVNGVTALITAPVRTTCSAVEKVSATYHSIKPQDEDVDMVSQMIICSKSGEILSIIDSLKQYVNDSKIDWRNLYDQNNKCTKTTWTESQFQRISEDLKKMPQVKLKKRALSLCNMGIAICRDLATYQPDQMWDEKETKQLIKKLQELNVEAHAFDCEIKATSGSPALNPKPPMMFKAENNSSGRQSASQSACENARFRIEQSREKLEQSQDSYAKCVENMEKNRKELTDVLVEMQNCQIKEVDFKTKIDMLVKGLDAMSRVKEQWEKMIRFFQMLSTLVKTSFSKTLHNFVTTADDTKKLSYNSKLFAKDLLYKQAFQASNIASLVHMISGTYTDVSNKYLMDRVSSLGKLMAMDKSKPEFLQERLNLQESCQAAQEGILQLVMKNKKEFESKTDARMAKIEGELIAILPAAPPQETERIMEIVQAGFKEAGFGEE